MSQAPVRPDATGRSAPSRPTTVVVVLALSGIVAALIVFTIAASLSRHTPEAAAAKHSGAATSPSPAEGVEQRG
ncbi:hypothetical protein FHX42_003705 [Saccharopolyspora lacisalsi]|uniref:Uncharacterized protein n=1 Tax=Halosaccharopolyspora lacisalsi TaxID=1000566 RepID=A0A839E084_9PSEU|nr:hypothetical protein [Halosaccharopolyspora lacisalsi]MBA8826329.1 hypothetical protein [Halosaccharopolyspora lacisalsi]